MPVPAMVYDFIFFFFFFFFPAGGVGLVLVW